MKYFIKKYENYLTCILASFFSFYDLLQLSLYNSIISNVALAFRLSSTKLSLISSVFLFANAFGLVPIGFLIDRYSVRIIVILFLSVSVLSSVVIADTNSWVVVLAMRFLQGLTSAASLLTCMRVAIICFRYKVNSAIGLMLSFALLGGFFGNYVFIHVVHYIGWRNGLRSVAIIGFALVIMWVFLTPSKKLALNVRPTRLKLDKIKAILFSSKNFMLGLYLGLMSLPIFILASLWGNFYLHQVYLLTSSEAALAVSFIFIGLIIGSPLTGYFSDKIGNLKLIMVFGAGSSFFLILPFLLIHHMTFIQITLLLTLLGMSISTQNVAFVVIADNNLEETLSMATGTASFILNAVGALSQLLFGWLLKASWQDLNYMTTSSLIKSSYVSSVLIFPLAFLLCVFLAIFSLNKKL